MAEVRETAVRRFDDGVDQWHMVNAAPAASLRGLVTSYCSYQETTRSFNERRELASTRNVLLLNLGSPIEVVGPRGDSLLVGEGDAFVSGVCSATSWSRSTGGQSGVEISAAPEIMERLLGLPLSELSDRVVAVADLWGSELRESMLRLRSATSDDERFALCDALVAQRLDRVEPFDPDAAVVRRELQREQPASVKAIAAALGWSEKRVARRLRQHIGVSPSGLRRLARFERFWSQLASGTGERLSDLAVDAGYFDQPHLNREVKAFSGLTPTALRAHLLPAGGGFLGD